MEYILLLNEGEHEETYDTPEEAFGAAMHAIETQGGDDVEDDLWKVEVIVESDGVEVGREVILNEGVDNE